jgi:hypothetical protein
VIKSITERTHDPRRICTEDGGDLQELDHVESALSALVLATNDCGRPRLSATSCWVRPAFFLAATSSSRNLVCWGDRIDLLMRGAMSRNS